jgi:hypothetical protein
MADGQVATATPQVNPVGGASSSWGDTNPSMIRVLAPSPDNTAGLIPETNLPGALKDGARLGARVKAPDGTLGTVPLDSLHEALHAGGQLIGEDPVAPVKAQVRSMGTPRGMKYLTEGNLPGRAAMGLADTAKGLVGMIPAIGQAFTQPPSTPEEDALATGAAVGSRASPLGPVAGKFALAAKRLLYDPQRQEVDQAQRYEEGAANPAYSPEQQDAMQHMANIHRAASLIPLVGPLAAGLTTGIRGDPLDDTASPARPYGEMGDPVRAGTSLLSYAAAPAAQERILSELKPLLPTASDIGGAATAAAKGSGIGLTPEEKLIKAGGPSVIGQEGANLPKNLRIAGPRLAEQNSIRKIQTVQDLADGSYNAARRVWDEGYQPQIDRHPNATFNATDIGDQVRGGVDEGMRDLFPEQAAKADEFAKKFDGPMSLSKASSYLKALNAQLKGYYRLTPEARAAAGLTDGMLSAYSDAAEGLRNKIDDTLEAQGEKDPRGLRQEYGALKGIQRIYEKRAVVTGRQAPLNLPQVLSMAGGAGEAASALFAGHPLAAAGGAIPFALATALKHLNLPDTLVKRGIAGLVERGESARPLDTAPPTPPAGAGPTTPPVVPPVGPFARGAQGGLPFGAAVAPPVAGEAPAPAPEPPPAMGAQPSLWRKPWEVGQAQTPTPAGNVAPAVPESPQGALQPLPVSPERAALQDAALQDAATRIKGGQRDKASYEAMREAARVPEMEPEHLRNVKQTRDLRQVNGQYTPEALAAQDVDINKVLGPRKAPEAKPKVVMMVGGAASGKGGLGVQADNPGLPTIDSDVFKLGDEKLGVKGIPESKILLKSDPLGAADRMHEESSDISKRAVTEAINRRQSVIVDKVNGNPEKLQNEIKRFKAAGYDVDLRGVDKNLDEAMNAMVGRARGTGKNGGRWVPTHILEEGHIGAARAYHEAVPLLNPETDTHSLHIAKPAVEGGGYRGKDAFELVADQNGVYNSVRYAEHRATKGGLYDGRYGLVSGRQGLGGSAEKLPEVRAGEPQSPERNQGATVSGGTSGTVPTGEGAAAEQRPATVPATEQGKVALHLADNAPPKNKPVILVQGGGYNPAHDGHVAAMQSAHDLLTGAGYTVDGHVVAPTADKLLAKKLGSDDRLSVEDRANIAKAAYPPEINGKPVEVQTGPAAEVEAMDRKPKRSDLAKNIQRQYPNHTVINVSGEDAGVPGAPANQPAALYQGDPGTSHEGINYITVPRVGGHSSTQIRNAYAAGEATLPGMNPEAERLYREAMAEKEAPEPVSTARQDVQVAQGQRIAGHDGSETTVRTPTGDKYPGRYRVVEGDTLTPSHDPMTFAKNPNYPEGVQERAYHSSKEAQNRVIQQAQNYDPGYTVNTDPTGSNGPAIITPDGTVLGGNSRVMSTDRLYRSGQGDVYKNELIKQAGQFGLDPEQIRGMKNPHLVREIEAPSSQEELRRIGKDLNRSMTGAPSVSERAVSAGKSLKPASLEEIGHMVDQTGEGASLREAMQKHGPDMLKVLQRDGVITDRERPALTDSSTGGLNEDGKNFVEKTLIGSIVEDPDLMSRTPKNVVNKLGSSVGDVASLAGRGDEYNITSLIRAALREHVAAAERGGPLEDHLRQQPMFGPARNPAVDTMARALDGPVKNLRASLRSFAQDARADVPGQRTMLLTGKQSATDAFNHAFGTSLSEDEFREALKSALLEERHTGKL